MSVNWVMVQDHEGFVRLPNEQLLFKSPPRTSLSLQPFKSYTGSESISLQSNGGVIYLTNQRIIYLPSQTTKEFQSFSAPLTNIHDSHVSAPFFGPNVWTALVQPVSGGGIPPSLHAVQVKVTFKEGGAFDFQNSLERIKERLQDAMEVSPDTARGLQNVNMSGVHLEELPAYEGPPGSSSNTGTTSATSIQEQGPSTSTSRTASTSQDSPYSGPEPNEPPPGYEEVQQQSVANELEETLRRAS